MAEQLTPRVVRTVEELEGLPGWTHFIDAEGREWFVVPAGVWPDRGDGRVFFHAVTGSSGNYRADRVFLPAMVLAPLSVTAEQVALITDPRYPDGRAFGPVFTDSVHEAFRRGVDTALAAMGIPVVES